ncbi:MAG TPA: cupin domain-containing protein [Xanthobacteraceae bacterium]|nr:cupin domain-containing protein [Xanthobacteraceae bacterium]
MSELNQPAPPGKFLVDPYQEWVKREGVPIHTGAAVDLLQAETKPWPRFGASGAACHLNGRDDFLTVFLLEIAPQRATAPQRHLYEEISYVLSGRGVTEFELGGRRHSIEWGPRSLFAVPMNARYRHSNTSAAPARIACINDLRYLFSLYRSETFVFDTPVDFPERGDGTILLSDAAAVPVQSADGIGRAPLTLAKGSIGADAVEVAPGMYQQAARQMQGAHLFGVAGEGYTLTWEEGSPDLSRTAWRHGVVYAAPGLHFHQHFNAGAEPLRYLDIQLGSLHDPMFRHRRAAYGDKTVYAAGNATISYAQQDPRIHELWLKTVAGKGVTARVPIGA